MTTSSSLATMLGQWRGAASASQDAAWADPLQRTVLQRALLWEGLGAAQEAAESTTVRRWIEQLSFLHAATALPGKWLAAVTPQEVAGEILAADWLQVIPAPAQPIDMELDLLAEKVESQDFPALIPLIRSMVQDVKARGLVADRLLLRVADDSYGDGLRARLFHATLQLAQGQSEDAFVVLVLLALRQHWQLPDGNPVVVPEGRADRRSDSDKALLQALRERDLPAFLGHVRAMGDQPTAALRQLFLATALMILEFPDGTQLQDLGAIYLWLAAVLQMPHRSLRRSRRILFSVASCLFRFAGWERQGEWPGYGELAAFRHGLTEWGPGQQYAQNWQRVLYWQSLGEEALTQWYLQQAQQELQDSGKHTPHFWALWTATQSAGNFTGGPLLWVHPLVFLRLCAR
ncbi:MAG: hypothetical protein K0041_06955 [Acidithiobacillus sp.]|nr:hypothetical protein [Acidithiobacillus sp.]